MPAGPDTLRVSVVAGHDRVDVVVPAGLSVAELVPELLVRLGDTPLAPGDDLRLSRIGGPPLAGAVGLADQGVPDGSLLTLTAESDHVQPVDDDLTRVVAEAAERLPRPGPGSGARAAHGVAVLLVAVAAAGVAADRAVVAAGAAATAAVVFLLVALVAAHRALRTAATLATWSAVALGAAAGTPWGLVGAGTGCVVVGTVGACLGGRRVVSGGSAPLAGAVLVLVGTVAELWPGWGAAAATGALALVVAAADLAPWPAAAFAGLSVPPLGQQPPVPPEPDAVAAAVRRAHEVLLCCSVATGLLLVVLGPVVVLGLGAWGLAVVLLCAAILALRSRQHRVGPGGLPGLAAALAVLVPVAVAAWVRWPGHHPAVLVATLLAGLVVLAASLLAPPRTVRAGRVAELAEALALASLPPAVLIATGLLDVARGIVR